MSNLIRIAVGMGVRIPACNLWVRANQEDDAFVIDKTGKK
jgi:hypothetical protein